MKPGVAIITVSKSCFEPYVHLQLKLIMDVKMCYMFILDENTQELVCQVRTNIMLFRLKEYYKHIWICSSLLSSRSVSITTTLGTQLILFEQGK